MKLARAVQINRRNDFEKAILFLHRAFVGVQRADFARALHCRNAQLLLQPLIHQNRRFPHPFPDGNIRPVHRVEDDVRIIRAAVEKLLQLNPDGFLFFVALRGVSDAKALARLVPGDAFGLLHRFVQAAREHARGNFLRLHRHLQLGFPAGGSENRQQHAQHSHRHDDVNADKHKNRFLQRHCTHGRFSFSFGDAAASPRKGRFSVAIRDKVSFFLFTQYRFIPGGI